MISTRGTNTRVECSSRNRIVRGVMRYMKAEPKLPGKRAFFLAIAGTDQVDVGPTIDLAASEEEQVDTPLTRQVEQFAVPA